MVVQGLIGMGVYLIILFGTIGWLINKLTKRNK